MHLIFMFTSLIELFISFQGDNQRPVQSMLDRTEFSKWSHHHRV